MSADDEYNPMDPTPCSYLASGEADSIEFVASQLEESLYRGLATSPKGEQGRAADNIADHVNGLLKYLEGLEHLPDSGEPTEFEFRALWMWVSPSHRPGAPTSFFKTLPRDSRVQDVALAYLIIELADQLRFMEKGVRGGPLPTAAGLLLTAVAIARPYMWSPPHPNARYWRQWFDAQAPKMPFFSRFVSDEDFGRQPASKRIARHLMTLQEGRIPETLDAMIVAPLISRMYLDVDVPGSERLSHALEERLDSARLRLLGPLQDNETLNEQLKKGAHFLSICRRDERKPEPEHTKTWRTVCTLAHGPRCNCTGLPIEVLSRNSHRSERTSAYGEVGELLRRAGEVVAANNRYIIGPLRRRIRRLTLESWSPSVERMQQGQR